MGLKGWFERLIFAGLKPGQRGLPGPASWGKRLGIAVGILLIGAFVFVLVNVLTHPAEQAEETAAAPPPVEIVPKGFTVDANKDLEVIAIEFNKSKNPKEITGTLRNRTDRSFAKCEISFSVTTSDGGQLGGVATTVKAIRPHGSTRFRIPVGYPEASFVMVRELRTE